MVVEAVRLIHHVHNWTQEAHDLIDDEIGCRRLRCADMEEEIGGRCGRRMMRSLHALKVLKLLRLLCLRKKILPRTVAEAQRELHGLRRNADIHRPLNRTDAIRHIGDDLLLLLEILTFEGKHHKDDALPRILEHILCKTCIDLHQVLLSFHTQ